MLNAKFVARGFSFSALALIFSASAAYAGPIGAPEASVVPLSAGQVDNPTGCGAIRQDLGPTQYCWDLPAKGEGMVAMKFQFTIKGKEMQIPSGYKLKTILSAQATLGQLAQPSALPQGAQVQVISQQVVLAGTSQKDTLIFQGVVLVKITSPTATGMIIGSAQELQLPVIVCQRREQSSGIGLVDFFGGKTVTCEGDQSQTLTFPGTGVSMEQRGIFTPAAEPVKPAFKPQPVKKPVGQNNRRKK
jgi:hypothetical protein